MIVATASASNATNVTLRTRPTVSPRQRSSSRPKVTLTGDVLTHRADTPLRDRRTNLGKPMRGPLITCPKCATEMPVAFSFCGKCGARLVPTALPSEGETKQVTVLFADISGFTALAERLGPEELHENMRAAWDAIAVEIRAAGGLIEKYIGDAVVA